MEKLGNFAGKWRTARHEEAEASPEPSLNLDQHQSLPQRPLKPQKQPWRRAALKETSNLLPNLNGPAKDGELRPASLLGIGHDAVVDLLENPRHPGQEGRAYRREVLHQFVHAAIDRGGEADSQL